MEYDALHAAYLREIQRLEKILETTEDPETQEEIRENLADLQTDLMDLA